MDQLDAYFTRTIEEGRLEEAAQAAAELDNTLNQKLGMQQSLMQGSFNMPGMDLGGAPAMDPNSAQGRGVLGSLANLPYMDPAIAQSPMHSQLAVQRGTQFIQNNPIVLQRQAAQKAAQERMGLTKSFLGDAFKQNQVGFQEGLGAFDNPAGFNLTREDRNLRSQERQFGQTTAQYQAAEPFKEKSMQRSIQLKQTPGARAGGAGAGSGGGSGSPDGEILSSVTNEDLSRMEKMLMRSSEFYAEEATSSGKMAKVLNNGGAQVLNIAADKLARMKKKNPMLAIRQATQEYKKQRGKPEDIIQGADRAANQVLSTPTPAPSSAPQQQGNTVQGQKDPGIEQKISKALQMGRTPEQIKEALKADGINPAMYGL